MASKTPLEELVNEWLRLDQNPKTRREIEILWEHKEIDELESRLRTRIEFGTAGLRGRMEAGWARMNDLIIIQASQGLCSYVLQAVNNAAERGIVIGHDHRHHSSRWAKLTAAAFVEQGVKVYLLKGLVHTPMVPFGVKQLRAACGVMITASHNPKDDNGYKVYWENAVQIIGPHDKGIAAAIRDNLQPRSWDAGSIETSELCQDKTDELVQAYCTHVGSLSVSRSVNSTTDVKFVNTSMHGVGHYFVTKAFKAVGLRPFIPVEEQREPDPDFPTVKFPNPEEKGALDLAIATASRNDASYVLAQDPDADRFSAAERGPNGWKIFTGDQLGTIFAGQILEQYKASGKPLAKLAMVASTVSSKMIEKMAELEGFRFVECLTGFKFIGNTALDLVKEGYEVPFGYEEAIGFMIGSEIRDKDGVAASVYFAQIVVSLHKQGKTAMSYLRELYDRYGHFQTKNSYFICRQPPVIDRIFARLRNYDGKATEEKPSYPETIAGLKVTSVCDLTIGYDTSNPPSYKPSLPLSSGHMIQFKAQNEDGTKIVLTTRTSGTEPKIKYYLEGSGKDERIVSQVLEGVVGVLGDEWFEANHNGLGIP
ncbi:uncharacterized protein STEHIDRAFT_121879 [Stereum hirsutum FP-91666 SS1]|uniref:uncharacterized protein n=1 Tax=Stereum hirsutum (strain FP-91666) TaxID=721885 RepID=UPI000444A2BB|nr:uncharacterized protein STEHIDRAFT_121879 [Stereum hirsutum FP-91666 SS1]EIM85880.1 hypothetical protein STEHIDRAFT_121879 [Stereum hirsutum FP-91666 SS1]